MRNTAILIVCVLVVFGISSFAEDAAKGKMALKVGDEVYACNCGDACTCNTISNREGKCGCGMALSKATVKKVGADTADLEFASGTRTLKTVGKYVCGCGGDCCKTISQRPGTCGCGKELVKVD